MKTINLFKKTYRELNGNHQNQAIQKIQDIFELLSYSSIEDAIYDTNPIVWYSTDFRFVKFEPKSFGRLCELVHEYELSHKKSN